MTRFERITEAAAAALSVPLIPAPARGALPCAVYRYHPGQSDGAMAKSRLEVRVFAPSASAAAREMTSLRRALVTDGDSGTLTDESGTLLICETDEGGGEGFLRGCGMYFMKAGFEIRGRA